MEALCFAPPQPHLRRPNFSNPIQAPDDETFRSNRGTKIKPSIFATLSSKQTAEVSSKPAVTSREKPLQAPPSTASPLRASSDSLRYPAGFLGAVPDWDAARGGGGADLNAMQYLTNILASRVYDVAIESPLQLATKVSERLGVNMWLKREDLQPVSHLAQCIDSTCISIIRIQFF
ncbi:Threonine dehydratase biosynthetic, chloroplastic [Sarracenia purpurea var. burkii]